MSDKTENKEKKEQENSEIDDGFKIIVETYEKKMSEMEERHKQEMQSLKEELKAENKKMIQSFMTAQKIEETKTEESQEDEEEDDENDHSIQAIENRTRKDLLQKFGLIKIKK